MDVPEYHFTGEQLRQLARLLGVRWADLNELQREELPNAGRWFAQELVYQRQPSASDLDRLLERIESTATRLLHNLSSDAAISQIQIAAFKDDLKPEEAVVAVQKLQKWAIGARGIVKGNRRESVGKAKKSAMRVLVHRLGLLWLHTHGTRPTISVSKNGKAGGPFIRFALRYLQTMRVQTTEEHRRAVEGINKELDISAEAIAGHLKVFLKRLTFTE